MRQDIFRLTSQEAGTKWEVQEFYWHGDTWEGGAGRDREGLQVQSRPEGRQAEPLTWGSSG